MFNTFKPFKTLNFTLLKYFNYDIMNVQNIHDDNIYDYSDLFT